MRLIGFSPCAPRRPRPAALLAIAWMIPSALWARAQKAPPQTTVQVEIHSSTTSDRLDATMKGSPSAAPAPSVSGSTAPAATANPTADQVNQVNQYIHELRSPSPAAWPRAARNLRALNPNLTLPTSVVNHLARVAYAPIERERTRGGWITNCDDQNNALDALAALGPQAHSTIPYLVRLTHRGCIHDHVVAALAALGAPDSDQIAQIAGGLNAKDPEARRAAVEYLANENPTPEIIRNLGRATNDPDSGVRLSALQALERIHPEGEGRLPALAPFLKDPSPEIRERALFTIGQLSSDPGPATTLLHQALHDSDSLIALESAQYLAKIDPQDDDLLKTLIAFAKKKNGAAPQAAALLESLHVHEARIDDVLEPYRKQESIKEQMDKATSGITPEQLADNARTLKVQSLRMASRIVQDRPVRTARVFPADVGRLYCWTEVSISSAPASVNYRWYRDGRLQHEDAREVLSAAQSLWSTAPVRPGHWKVDVTPAGASAPIATAVFTVSQRK